MTELPRVDVVIPTRDRSARLARLLDSLAAHAASELGDVIVVDDSTDPTVRGEDHPDLRIRVVRPGERTFISRARNLGLARVTAEYVAVLDDDNVVGATTLGRPTAAMIADREIGAVMPSVLYLRRPDLVWVYATPFRAGRWGFELIGRDRPRDPVLEGRLLPTDALPNAAIYRSDALRPLGGFDERMPVSSTADVCQRLKAAGHAVWADSGAFTFHDVEPPGTPGYWGAHAQDPDRLYFDVHDWFVLQRRVHADAPAFAPRACYHAAPFLLSSLVALALRRDARVLPTATALVRGVGGGLRAAEADRSGPVRYRPAG